MRALNATAITLIDLPFGGPAWELACDEALLDSCEAGGLGGAGVLRFWEADEHFVVLGIANKAEMEADAAANVPIFRRCSGGGSVLQGPGCLNYSLVLPMQAAPELANITQTNCYIMKRNRDALVSALGLDVSIQGYTDLTLHSRKFSGNSQRRKSRWLLFHGTFLLSCDLELMARVLRPPPRQPEYRARRSHSEFLTTLQVPAAGVKEALCRAWDAKAAPMHMPHAQIERLVHEKYSRREWNFRS